jgi:phage-related protein
MPPALSGCFQKKSQQTAKHDLEIAAERFKRI